MSSRPRSGLTPTDASSWGPSDSPFRQRAYRRRDIVTVPAHEILRHDLVGHIYHFGQPKRDLGKDDAYADADGLQAQKRHGGPEECRHSYLRRGDALQ